MKTKNVPPIDLDIFIHTANILFSSTTPWSTRIYLKSTDRKREN